MNAKISGLLSMVALWVTAIPCLADTTTCFLTGNWETPGNWTNGRPDTGDDAIIAVGVTCTVTQTDNPVPATVTLRTHASTPASLTISSTGKLEVSSHVVLEDDTTLTIGSTDGLIAGYVEVGEDATLEVNSNNKLTLTSDSTRSLIEGVIELTGTLYISDDHTIRGDGGRVQMIGGSIEGADDKILTIEGVSTSVADSLKVHGTGDIHVDLMNKAYVVADVDPGTLYLKTNVKDSTTAGHWRAEGGDEATLRVDVEVKGGGAWELIDTSNRSTIMGRIHINDCCRYVTGDVINTNGEFCVRPKFITTGNLVLESVGSSPATAPWVRVMSESVARFNVSGAGLETCP